MANAVEASSFAETMPMTLPRSYDLQSNNHHP
jgi:hypothetical protein